MHTEQEARQKWCPFDRSYLMRTNEVDVGECHCVASDCMAWRWDVEIVPPPVDRHTTIATTKRSDKGKCGLAGRS